MNSKLFLQNPPGLTEKLGNQKVGIAGCGGLGSNIAMMLVRASVQNLVLVDFDTVEMNNLNRQFYFQKDIGKLKTDALLENLMQINPEICIQIHNQKLEKEQIYKCFKDCHVIVEAFDTVEAKTMLIQQFQDRQYSSKYLVAASGLAGLKSANSIQTKRIANNIYVCGDFFTESNASSGLLSSRVMVTAAHQANMVVRILTENYKP
ncbi:MAG: sulfur carrier protein ThiS adenylyltransferase ThiF [Candidatus Marinimicrobia bacterium]|nr:sulfur carrier protein ThiS adenylyltransferase ThiF [Candidatus Neomarinimicrobiota bacterium]